MPGYDSLRRCLLVTVILFIMPSTYMQLLVLTLFHGIGVVIHMRCFPFASLDVGDFENYADAIVLVQGLLNVFVVDVQMSRSLRNSRGLVQIRGVR